MGVGASSCGGGEAPPGGSAAVHGARTRDVARGVSGRGLTVGMIPGMEDVMQDVIDADSVFDLGEDEGTGAAHGSGVAGHDFEVGADGGSEVGFVDHEKVALGEAGTAFAGVLVPPATSMTWMAKSASSRL